MGTEVVRQLTPEEWDLKKKKAELLNWEAKLAQRELDLATIQAELQDFQVRYYAAVGSRYWELDELEAQVAEIQAQMRPDDPIIRQKADQARTQADESAKSFKNKKEEAKTKSHHFKPSQSLKKLYRELAKCIHPDLATDEAERIRYQQLMAKANQAYQAGDEIGLKNILNHWKNSPCLERNNTFQDKLDKINQQINQIKERLKAINHEMTELKKTSLYQLKLKVEASEQNGLNLLSEMAHFLDQQIAMAKATLSKLR